MIYERCDAANAATPHAAPIDRRRLLSRVWPATAVLALVVSPNAVLAKHGKHRKHRSQKHRHVESGLHNDAGYAPDSEELAFLALINDYRRLSGCEPLALQSQLGPAAKFHSVDQATNGFSSHTGSNGSTDEDRVQAAGYHYLYIGENIYWNSDDGAAQAAFNWWRSSPPHNENMLNQDFRDIGIGRAQGPENGYWYWTTDFGQSR